MDYKNFCVLAKKFPDFDLADIEDAVQSAEEKVVSLNSKLNVDAFIMKDAFFTLSNRRRSLERRKTVSLEDLTPAQLESWELDFIDTPCDNIELRLDILYALRKFNQQDREPIVKALVEGYTTYDLAHKYPHRNQQNWSRFINKTKAELREILIDYAPKGMRV